MGAFTRVLLQGGQMIIMACTLSARPDTAKCARHSYHSGSCHGRPGNNYGLYTRPTQGALGSTARVARSKGDSVESRDAGVTAFRHLRGPTKRGSFVCRACCRRRVSLAGPATHTRPPATQGDQNLLPATARNQVRLPATRGGRLGPLPVAETSVWPARCRRHVSLARTLSPTVESVRPGHQYSTAGDTGRPKSTPGDSGKPDSTAGDT